MRFPEFEGEWKWYKLEEVATISKGSGISKEQLSEIGQPCILYGELYTKYKSVVIQEILSCTNIISENLVKSQANDVIIPSSGETSIDIATARCVPFVDILLGGDLNIIRLLRDNGAFLSYQLNESRKYDIAKIAQGASVVHLYGDKLKKLSIAICSIEEQNKIVKFLSLLDERIETQNKIIEELKLLKNTISNKLYSRKLRYKDDKGNDFQNWQIKRLKDMCEIIGGGTPETNKAEYWNGHIQWFTPTEIKSNFVSKSERTISELGLKNSSAKLLPEGSILLTTRATIGEVAITTEECATNQGFQSLIVKENYNSIFLFNWLKVNKYKLEKRANGSTFAEISKSEIEKIEIDTPSIKEQTKIANLLLSIDTKIAIEVDLLQKLEVQKKYLLADLFI